MNDATALKIEALTLDLQRLIRATYRMSLNMRNLKLRWHSGTLKTAWPSIILRVRLLVVIAIIISTLQTHLQLNTLSAQTELPPTPLTRTNFHHRTTDQLIVSFTTSSTNLFSAQQAIQSRISSLSNVAGVMFTDVGEHAANARVLKLQQKLDANQLNVLLQTLRDNAAVLGIESVELDEIRYASLAPDDTHYSQQWDLQPASSGTYGINAPAAWDVTTGSANYVVAVADTGIRLNHPDLAGRTVQGYDFVIDAQVGNDGNGRDSDPSDPGDWVTSAESAAGYFAGCSATSSSWHGTHVAGTIGAIGNNSLGIAGINWQSKILPVRVLGKCGGYDSDIIAGVRWAAGIRIAGVTDNKYPARVINLSLGGYNSNCNPQSNPDSSACKCPAEWQSAISEVVSKGMVVVAAAGNEDVPARAAVPNNCSGVISVAATNRQGNRASYSNYDSSVTIAAPGGDSGGDGILSTVDSGSQQPVAPTYDEYVGTSMAAPHVAGIVSLMVSVNPALAPAQLAQLLRSSVTTFPAGSSCSTLLCGAGIANAASAVLAARNHALITSTPTATRTPTVTATPTRTPGPTPTIDPSLTIKTFLPLLLMQTSVY